MNEVLKLRAEACLASLPAQLSKEYKKFQFSLVNAKGHSPEKADGLQYLEDIGLAVRAYNVKSLSCPLEAEKISTEFKVFFIDTGLLLSQLGFLFEKNGEVVIVECKASNNRATSMKYVIANPKKYTKRYASFCYRNSFIAASATPLLLSSTFI